jgi:hypothetical protein
LGRGSNIDIIKRENKVIILIVINAMTLKTFKTACSSSHKAWDPWMLMMNSDNRRTSQAANIFISKSRFMSLKGILVPFQSKILVAFYYVSSYTGYNMKVN